MFLITNQLLFYTAQLILKTSLHSAFNTRRDIGKPDHTTPTSTATDVTFRP